MHKMIYQVKKMPEDFDPWKDFYREWAVRQHGKSFTMRSYGFCHWEKIIFFWEDGREFYCLERDMKNFSKKGDKYIQRKEYFAGQLIRKYFGPKICFIEFCDFLRHREYRRAFPKMLKEKRLKLSKKVLSQYIKFYHQFFLK